MKLLPLIVAVVLAGGGDRPPAVHPLHLSTTQLALEGTSAHLRIRLFKDDLEAALAAALGVDSLRMSATPHHDSLFLDYFRQTYEVTLNGVPVRPVIVASGEDLKSGEGDERIWWVQLMYESDEDITDVRLRARILFEWFEDQRNIVRILHVESDKQRTLYFAAPDEDWARVSF